MQRVIKLELQKQIYATNYTDDFIADGMDGATVEVRAYGGNDTFGWWSDAAAITRFGY